MTEEKRRILEKRLKEMSEDNVVVEPAVRANSFDPSDSVTIKPACTQETKEERYTPSRMQTQEHFTGKQERQKRETGKSLTIEEYRSIYLQSVRSYERTAFSINLNTLQILRNVLQDLGERVSIASYIDNILREHLREHQELINGTAAKQRRKTTVTL